MRFDDFITSKENLLEVHISYELDLLHQQLLVWHHQCLDVEVPSSCLAFLFVLSKELRIIKQFLDAAVKGVLGISRDESRIAIPQQFGEFWCFCSNNRETKDVALSL